MSLISTGALCVPDSSHTCREVQDAFFFPPCICVNIRTEVAVLLLTGRSRNITGMAKKISTGQCVSVWSQGKLSTRGQTAWNGRTTCNCAVRLQLRGAFIHHYTDGVLFTSTCLFALPASVVLFLISATCASAPCALVFRYFEREKHSCYSEMCLFHSLTQHLSRCKVYLQLFIK